MKRAWERNVVITPELIECFSAWHQLYAPSCGDGIKHNNHCRHWLPFIAGYATSSEIGLAETIDIPLGSPSEFHVTVEKLF